MLTVDLVNARRHGRELRLIALDGPKTERALAMAESLLTVAQTHVGRTREEIEDAWDEGMADFEGGAAGVKLAGAVRKMVEDRCTYDAQPDIDVRELRRELFLHAAVVRRELGDGGTFDRSEVLSAVGASRGLAPDAIDRLLYADLRGANVLRAAPSETPEALVGAYELAQQQAALLRAVRITCDVRCATPAGARAFFRKLKFHRLLHQINHAEGGGYRVVVDGPSSLFEGATRYGVRLAMLLPTLIEVDAWSLEADVRWGKTKDELTLKLKGEGAGARADAAEIPDEVASLLAAVNGARTPWKGEIARTVLDVPGVGLLVPDLVFRNPTGAQVYLEVLGFWRRETVWQRVELAQQGLRDKVLFAVSERLRVSKDVLPDDTPAALYVYKGTMHTHAVIERLDALAARPDAARVPR